MVGADSVADLRLFLVLLCQFHTQEGVRQIRVFLRDFANVMQETSAFGDLGIQAQFACQDGADVGHLPRVLQQVLSIGGTVFHAADQAHQFHAKAMDAQVYAGAFAGFQDFFFQLLGHLGNHFLDAGRMDAAVHHQLVQGQAGYFAAHRVESAEKDGVRGVVHHNLHARSGLQRADVAAFAADDAALHLVVVDGEGGDGILDGRFRGGALDGVDDNALGLFGGVQACIVQAIVDVSLGF